jgi:hypothetical protein
MFECIKLNSRRKAYWLGCERCPLYAEQHADFQERYHFRLRKSTKAFRKINQQKELIMNKSNLKLSITFILVVLFVATTVNGYWSYNLSSTAFPNQGEEPGNKSATVTSPLEQLIIDAAGFYLRSTSDYQLLLRETELSGIPGTNVSVLQELIGSAVSNLELANSTYYQLWQTSKYLEYDPVVLEKLHKFNYNGYQAVNHLNPEIFKQVADFLKAGDVRGSYERAYHATGEILERIKTLKTNLDKNTLPSLAECWRLNQLFLETELFGQYVAEVFFSLE